MNRETLLDDTPDLRQPRPEAEQSRIDRLQGELERALRRLHRLRYMLILLAAMHMALFYRHFSDLEPAGRVLFPGIILLFGLTVFFGLRYPVAAFGGALLLQLTLLWVSAGVYPLPVIRDLTLNVLIAAFLALGIYHGLEVKAVRRRLDELEGF